MIKNSSLLLLGAAVSAGFLLMKKGSEANAARQLEFTNPKVKLGSVSLGGTQLLMTIDFVNNTSTDIHMEYFQGSVNYAGKQLSSFTFNAKDKTYLIKARGVTTIPLTVVIKNIATLSTLIKLVKAITSGQSVSAIINIDGHFYALGLDLPVTFDWDLKTNSLAKIPAKKVSGIVTRRKQMLQSGLKNNGVGSVSARLEFPNNTSMENYFEGKKSPIKYFSKN